MTSAAPRLAINRLTYTGKAKENADLVFVPKLNVLYGASNSGKTFTVKSIDFMLGGKGPLPGIKERVGYEKLWMALHLPKSGGMTLMRALVGGAFALHPGHVTSAVDKGESRKLSAKNDATNLDNLSQFLLHEIDLVGREIVFDVNGKKRPLSFRDLVRYCLVDEVSIQSETSPVESGQVLTPTPERSVFKLLLTGQDDSAVVTVLDRKTFRTTTSAKLEMLDELLVTVNEELESDFPDSDGLAEQSKKLDETWAEAQRETQAAQESIREKLGTKNRLARLMYEREQRRAEIQINFGRFEQLESVYQSDIKRLEAIEEAGFILSLAGDRACPLCGATPEDQHHSHGLVDIKNARDAANVEVDKIRKQQGDLALTIERLSNEGLQIEKSLGELEDELMRVEADLMRLAPVADATKRKLNEVLEVRDRVRRGLELLQQKQSLSQRKEELQALKPTPKADRPQLGVATTVMHDFAQMVSNVLIEWQFPGARHVAFDDSAYDLRIDGKNRRDNGKGVRAITHAAFKVALLMFCYERNLPHPGFLVLDTPLLTYRDPIKSNSPLGADEQALRKTSLKEHFFEHISKISSMGQIIVVENIDLPTNIRSLAHVEVFTGDPTNGRFGLFPFEAPPP
jgi:hypothetical protein